MRKRWSVGETDICISAGALKHAILIANFKSIQFLSERSDLCESEEE